MEGKITHVNAEPKPRYYVVRMDGNGKAPTRPYFGRAKAHRSAEALARKNPGVEFIVVKQKSSLTFEPNALQIET